MSTPKIERALLSVFNKEGIVTLAGALAGMGVELLATAGTAKVLKDAGIPIGLLSSYTGQEEFLGGRVKTLHPKLLGGILARRSIHREEMAHLGILPIDLVVVNLYPFAEVALRDEENLEAALEQIDIGGSALLRAGAKNFQEVVVLYDPEDYGPLLEELKSRGGVSLEMRRRLAAKAFNMTADYDSLIHRYLSQGLEEGELPETLTLNLKRKLTLRYGENPQQRGALYCRDGGEGALLSGARKLQGKELSYNNILDAGAAIEIAAAFDEVTSVIVKHMNPSGVGLGVSPPSAFRRALAADPASAYGGIVAFNRSLDLEAAEVLGPVFIEVLLAPAYDEGALGVLGRKKGLRVLEVRDLAKTREIMSREQDLRAIPGGVLVQEQDTLVDDPKSFRVVTKRSPTEDEFRALQIAWKVVKFVKSNAIVLADTEGTVGIGAGQMSRVDAVKLAIDKVILPVERAVLASDAFFPFRDSIDLVAKVGIRAIIQPGGSRRDAEVIAAAEEYGIAMLFTGTRHFRH